MELIEKELTGAIIGAAMEVHSVLGCGFLEAVYHEALEMELAASQLVFVRQPEMRVTYKGRILAKTYQPDLIIAGRVVVELKALNRLSGLEEAQLLNYLKGTGLKVGLLFNFGGRSLEWKRLVS